MLSQPAWFQRLDEILTLLWGFDTGYLDRQAPSDGDTLIAPAPADLSVGFCTFAIVTPSSTSYAPGATCSGMRTSSGESLVHEHINLHGRYYFGVTEAVQRGELRFLRDPRDAIQEL